MNSSTQRWEESDSPISDLVAKSLDDDCLIGGKDIGRFSLLAQIRDQIVGCIFVQSKVVAETRLSQLGFEGRGFSYESADRKPGFEWAT
jgi:hypothetical protein